jgi:hypothetical protein
LEEYVASFFMVEKEAKQENSVKQLSGSKSKPGEQEAAWLTLIQ